MKNFKLSNEEKRKLHKQYLRDFRILNLNDLKYKILQTSKIKGILKELKY